MISMWILSQGILEVTAAQQRVTAMLDTPEYSAITGVPQMSPRELDAEIDRIRAELNEFLEQLEEV